MAVYKRGYEPYQGPLTPEWSRFLIIARYAYRRVFDSRPMITFFVVCGIYPAVCAALLYLPHNAAMRELMGGRNLFAPDNTFFVKFLGWQGALAYMLTGFLGPGLVSGDLANNALPLYFCRPFSRLEYIIGKMSVLAILLSAITWVPGLMLFGFAGYLEGLSWTFSNWWIGAAMFVGSWVWIAALCLLALAMSAWVRWRIAAGALIFSIFFVAAGFGQAMNQALDTRLGNFVNIAVVIHTIWQWLFRYKSTEMGIVSAWTAMIAGCAVCCLLLSRKLRAYHVERS